MDAGHVLAQVAYGADAYTWTLGLARTGREPGPRADATTVARAAVLPAERPADRPRTGLDRSAYGSRALPAPAWGRPAGRRHPACYLPLRCLREAETHHVDLAVGHGTEQ
ncbi:hypothetical protein [Streptomyces sp. KHY 26]|uniref:hypothetical protein n=1 Tax=Streptomyces sp. KHY 26 TaxID=3097359 RepID=UPI00376F2512